MKTGQRGKSLWQACSRIVTDTYDAYPRGTNFKRISTIRLAAWPSQRGWDAMRPVCLRRLAYHERQPQSWQDPWQRANWSLVRWSRAARPCSHRFRVQVPTGRVASSGAISSAELGVVPRPRRLSSPWMFPSSSSRCPRRHLPWRVPPSGSGPGWT